jgi:hypothetical protein
MQFKPSPGFSFATRPCVRQAKRDDLFVGEQRMVAAATWSAPR